MVNSDETIITDKTASVLIVDDHPIVRYGISRILSQDPELSVCGEAESPEAAMEFFEAEPPDAVIIDISLEGVLDGIRLTKKLRRKFPKLPILILSMHDEMTYAQKSLSSGASGYIMKEESSDRLISAIKSVLAGEIYVSEAVKKKMVHSFTKPKKEMAERVIDTLSERECQVFGLVGKGLKTRIIAEDLHVSVKTIETHIARIKLKLAIKSTPELVLAASAWVRQERMAPVF